MSIVRSVTVGLAAVLALCLGASGVTYALWTSQATASSSVAAGKVGVTLSGTDALAVTYTSSTLSKSAAITVLNTGTVSVNYSTAVALTSGASSPLASAAVVKAWPSSGDCSSAPSDASAGSWSSVPSLTGTLAAGASAVWCVLTSITLSQAGSLGPTSVSPTFTVTGTVGSWSASSATATVVQTVAAPVPTPPTTPPVDPAAWNLVKTTLSPLCVTPINVSGSTLIQSSCIATDNFQVWRFAISTSGVGEIIQRGWSGTSARWVAGTASVGSVVGLSTTSSAASQWKVTANTNGTVTIALVSAPTLCAAVNGASTSSGTAIVLATCVTGAAAQQFQVAAIANPHPPAVVFTCAGDNYNAKFSWPQLTGYAGSVVYRVKLDGVDIPTSQYGGGSYDNPYVTFQNTTSALVDGRSGPYALTVEQSVNGTAWTTTGTGTLSITPGTWGGKFVNCG